MVLDSDEVCSVAVLLTACTVFMWKRLCICSGWGTETRAGTVQLIPSLQFCIFSCQFFFTCSKFLVPCFKISSRERGSIAYRDSWSQVADKPSLAVFFQLLPALVMALLELCVPWMSLCVLSPDEQHCVHRGLHTAIPTDIILPVRPFLNRKATCYRLSFFFFLKNHTFLPDQDYV